MITVNAFAAHEAGGKLEPFQYELPELGNEQVDIKVHYCGLCHSDLSMLNNDWGMSEYPLVPGHEVVGEIIATGSEVKDLKVGDLVGLGWLSGSCMHCDQCTTFVEILNKPSLVVTVDLQIMLEVIGPGRSDCLRELMPVKLAHYFAAESQYLIP